MRRNISWIAVVFVVFFGTSFLSELPPVQATETPSQLENGDVNGDGERDISDAVYLLSWLYLGGPRLFECTEALNGDVNGDGERDLSDAVFRVLPAALQNLTEVPDFDSKCGAAPVPITLAPENYQRDRIGRRIGAEMPLYDGKRVSGAIIGNVSRRATRP